MIRYKSGLLIKQRIDELIVRVMIFQAAQAILGGYSSALDCSLLRNSNIHIHVKAGASMSDKQLPERFASVSNLAGKSNEFGTDENA